MEGVGIIWDFDGVLVFTPHEEAWRRAAEHYGAGGFDHGFYVRYVSGKPRYEGAHNILQLLGIYEKFGATDGEKRQKLLHEFAEFKNRLVNEMFERGEYGINEAAIEFLVKSRKLGVRHALASASKNATKLAERIKVNMEGNPVPLGSLFDINVSGMAPTKKEVFKLAVEEMRSKFPCIGTLLVVEDAPAGVRAAKELGLLTLGYEREAELDAHIRFKDFSELDPDALVALIAREEVRG